MTVMFDLHQVRKQSHRTEVNLVSSTPPALLPWTLPTPETVMA